jgi:peptide/nickel transport system substrate-binding protein
VPANDPTFSVGMRPFADAVSGARLVRTAHDGRTGASLARSWEWLPGRLGLRLRLRTDARFHDGSPVTADAVKASLEAALADPMHARQYPMLQDIVSIDAEDDRTVLLGLARPSALLLDDLEVPIGRTGADGRPVGAGAYFVEEERPDRLRLRASPHYHGGRPPIEGIELRPYPNVRTAWAAMMRDEVDALLQVPADAREFLAQESSVRVIGYLRPYVYTVVLNLRRPQFRSTAVRQALSLAVDRREIIDTTLRGHGRAASGYAWPNHWMYEGTLGPGGYDPGRAAEMLAAAGFDVRRPSARRNDPHFTCLVPAGLSPHEQMAIVLQKQFSEVGVDMAIEALPVADLIRRLSSSDFDAVLLDLNGGPGLARLYTFWHSSARGFYADLGYRSADLALEAMRAAPDENALRDAALEAQRVLREDPPAIFLCWPEVARAVARRFELPDASEADAFLLIDRWRILPAPPLGRRAGNVRPQPDAMARRPLNPGP